MKEKPDGNCLFLFILMTTYSNITALTKSFFNSFYGKIKGMKRKESEGKTETKQY